MKMKLAERTLKKVHMIYVIWIVTTLLLNSISFAQWSSIDPGRYDTTWWNRTPIRLIQTNLREIDALMDVIKKT